MKNIIVPVDFSEYSTIALEKAILIAEKVYGDITLLHVNETESFGSFFGGKKHRSEEGDIEEKVTQLKSKYGQNFKFETRKGKIHKEIVNLAEELDAWLIVMGTHGVSGFEEFWVGSNAYKVVSSAPCPVITTRLESTDHKIEKIVLPIDNSVESRQKVPITMDFAQYFKAEVHVVAVCTDDTPDLVEKMERYRKQVADFLGKHNVKCVEDISHGENVTEMTIEYAKKINADLISIMTEQESAASNLILGPYAQQMVNHSTIPVLTSRPDESAHHYTY